jgi:hypothetical protein
VKSEKVRTVYFWITNFVLASFAIVTIILILVNRQPHWGVLFAFGASVFGTLITLLLSSQKQALEELTVIRQLFKEFNDRYHAINKDLNRIKENKTEEPLCNDDINLLYDYFNLCSEEYLYFKRGYIYPEVWRAWCKGMLDYLNNERICKLWNEEEKKASYYGLTYAIIISANGGTETTPCVSDDEHSSTSYSHLLRTG